MLRDLAGPVLSIAASALLLTACSGGSSAPSSPVKSVVPTPQPTQNARLAASATFTIVVPASAKAGASRRPDYISAATKSIELSSSELVPAGPVVLNVTNTGSGPGAGSGANTSGSCIGTPTTGPFTCTLKVNLAIGADTVMLSTFDAAGAAGNLLSQQSANVSVLEGVANGPADGQSNASEFAITLDANAATMTVSATSACESGAVATTVATVNTTPVTFVVGYTDLATKTVTSPGLPALAVTSSGVTGGSIGISIDQATASFVLTPSGPGVGGTILVRATPANASDNLAFLFTKSFTFSSGASEPPNLLAVPEQGGTAAGQVNLYAITVGSGSGSSDSFVAASPATLSDENNDVDNPQAVAFDATGNLLIANGGTTVAGDTGNVACVPAGAITTGAAASTTTSTFADDPDAIAYGSDGSIGIANEAGGATEALATYDLAGNYVAESTAHDIAGSGAISVAALPNAAYAVSLPAQNKVDIISSGGTTTQVTSATDIVSPESIAFDLKNQQLLVNNNPSDPTSQNAYVSFFNSSGGFLNHVLLTDAAGNQYTGAENPGTLAASADGHIAAVAYDCTSYEGVFIFDGTAAHHFMAVIPFNATTTSGGVTEVYGSNASVRSLTWLSNTKLLIALESTGSSTAVADPHEGLYTFDISASAAPAGFDDGCVDLSAEPLAPKQTGFQHTTLPPLATAFDP
jgi:hypothetical protein